MIHTARTSLAIAAFDVSSELRRPAALLATATFSMGALVALHLAVAGGGRVAPAVAAGGLWIVILFGSLLGTGRVIAVEREDGSWDRLIAAPVDRGAIYAAKALSAWCQALIVHAVLVPGYLAMFGMPAGRSDVGSLVLLAAAVVLADAGLAAIGVLAGMLALRARGRDLLGAAIFLPLSLPLVVAAVGLSLGAWGASPLAGTGQLLTFLAAYDLTFVVVGIVFVPQLAVE